MVAAELPGTDEERAEAALIAAAGKILRAGHREVPEDFIAGIFAHAAPEDLLRYDPRQLAELAADAWSLLAVRKPGVPNIRLDTVAPRGRARAAGATISVLEIVNDDMPFLVDSVLAESAERGIDVRFVVHPVWPSSATRRAVSPPSRRPKPLRMPRESFIYIHLETDRRRGAPRRDRRGHRTGACRHPPLRRRLAADDEARRGCDRRARANPPPVPARRDRRSCRISRWLDDDNFTFLGFREYKFSGGEDALGPCSKPGSAFCAPATCGWSSAGTSRSCITPGDPRAPAGADAAHRHQVRTVARRPSAASIWTMSA